MKFIISDRSCQIFANCPLKQCFDVQLSSSWVTYFPQTPDTALQRSEIAETKMQDLNAFTIESAMKMIAGTARSMGVKVSGQAPWAN